ncbi:MAG: hypothetical protein HKL82_05810 [Acidimicrobiaceae bacterium]|nr:hypothetical protein [Acidimicrobiaceae bacterium]
MSDGAPTTRRNPYVLLGIPFGSTRELASIAFATRARGLRRAANGAERLKDLTWALNQVEEVLREPRMALEIYRVPADFRCYEPLSPGIFSPTPERLVRQSGPSAPELEQLFVAAEDEALAAARSELGNSAALPQR